jgi:hypothetical protein
MTEPRRWVVECVITAEVRADDQIQAAATFQLHLDLPAGTRILGTTVRALDDDGPEPPRGLVPPQP